MEKHSWSSEWYNPAWRVALFTWLIHTLKAAVGGFGTQYKESSSKSLNPLQIWSRSSYARIYHIRHGGYSEVNEKAQNSVLNSIKVRVGIRVYMCVHICACACVCVCVWKAKCLKLYHHHIQLWSNVPQSSSLRNLYASFEFNTPCNVMPRKLRELQDSTWLEKAQFWCHFRAFSYSEAVVSPVWFSVSST